MLDLETRLGEVRKQLQAVVNANGEMVLEAEPIYGGQAHRISNFSAVVTAIGHIVDQKWNDVDPSELIPLLEKHDEKATVAEVGQAEYAHLTNYITAINAKLPIYYAVIKSMTAEQDPQVINVKLPKVPEDLKSLTEFNQRLDKLLKEFKVDGEIKFLGFDKGSDWYVICISSAVTYQVLISGLKIAQEFLKTRQAYYDSEKAKLDFLAARESNEVKKEDLEAYRVRRMELEIEEQVRKALAELSEKNGHTVPELQAKVVRATKDLIKEMDEGVEFHLSLNPPKYAEEDDGKLTIDYTSIPRAVAETAPPKQLEQPKDKQEKQGEAKG